MKQKAIYIKIDENGHKRYYSDRKMTVLHRTDGPAIECSDGYKAWWQNGQRHRFDGPAVEYADGSKSWWQNDQRHRLNGPAVEYVGDHKAWYVNDRLHRTDGPAIEWFDGTKEWYIDGKHLTEAEFKAATTVHELTLDDIAARLGIAVESLKIVKEH